MASETFFISSGITLAVILCGTITKTVELSGGGSVVAKSLGGRLVSPNTADLDERKLLNVVEEMAIASGAPAPRVYLMDEEKGINAFAAGYSTNDAVISVTRGCIKNLTRDELQGVIGHEFSHILNGDMRLNLRLMGIIFGILSLATIGRILLRTRGRKNPLPLFGLALLLIGSVGVFFGRLIQAAVSRQREFLADAASVQYTRNPSGLSGALQKIGGSVFGSRLKSEHAHEAGHMFFGNALRRSFLSAFATHPPLEDRIRALEPAWDGKFKVIPELVEEELESLKETAARLRAPLPFPPLPSMRQASGLSGTIRFDAGATARQAPPPVRPQTVLANIGNPTPLHLRYAEQLRESFPDAVRAAAHDPHGAVALIYVLLLSRDEEMRSTQLRSLASRVDSTIYEKVVALCDEVAEIAARARLPLVNLTLPALHQLRPSEFKQFSETLKWLIKSDEQIDLFEFTLQKIVRRHLELQFGQAHRVVIQYYSIKPLLPHCSVLLSALARVGSDDNTEIARAFQKGVPYLRAREGKAVLSAPNECSLEQVDPALDRLAQAAPQIKKNFIEACAHVVGADGLIQEYEAELLRAFADTLDCPIPPFVTAE